jgi:DNA-binding GntR family transcriptional regulator
MTTTAKTPDLARDLSEGIASGRYAVGTLLPTEFELCAQYGLSRYAVRKALDGLQELGLISRRKNVGTRVEAQRPQAGFTQSIATVEELARFGAEHVRTVQSFNEVVADLALAKDLGCPGGTRWLHIACLRMEGGSTRKARPICWLDLYIDPAYADIGPIVRDAPETLASTLIEERHGRRIARIRQDIEAVLVPREHAEALRAEAGAPALKITRHYLDAAEQVFEISVSLHPADRFKFSLELTRSRE